MVSLTLRLPTSAKFFPFSTPSLTLLLISPLSSSPALEFSNSPATAPAPHPARKERNLFIAVLLSLLRCNPPSRHSRRSGKSHVGVGVKVETSEFAAQKLRRAGGGDHGGIVCSEDW